MDYRRRMPGWLGLMVCLAGPSAWCGEPVQADSPSRASPTETVVLAGWFRRSDSAKPLPAWPRLDLDALPEEYRARVLALLEKPTIQAQGPAEAFHCQPVVYHWLLDHPDRAVEMWRKLGAEVTPISARGNDRFGWKDDQGSDMHWDVVVRAPHEQVWYAEGVVRPGPLLPVVPVRALLVLHITAGHDAEGRSAVRHQAELVLRTDSRAANLAARLLGASAPRMAEQYVAQIQTFFAALAWHLDEHPEKARKLIGQE